MQHLKRTLRPTYSTSVGAIMVIVVIAVAAMLLAGCKEPVALAPSTEHDGSLGVDLAVECAPVEFNASRAEADRRIVLVNNTSRAKMITAVRSSCGCTTARVSRESVPPGETVHLDVQVRLPSPGMRTEFVRLLFDDGSLQTVGITAIGVAEFSVMASAGSVDLHGDDGACIILMVRGQDLDRLSLPAPMIDRDDLVLEWDGWVEVAAPNEQRSVPGRWKTNVCVKKADALAPSPRTAVVRVGSQETSLRLDGYGW